MGEGERITGITIEGCEIKGISDFTADFEAPYEYLKENTIVKWNDDFTLTATCKFSRTTYYKLLGLWGWVIENCPNKRVVHLMRYGKNDKVKMKNLWHGLRIIEKILSRGVNNGGI